MSVPVISFGTQGFGNYFGRVSEEEAVMLIKRAIELGVNHFDCALCYGDSMLKLALALHDIPREKVIISARICLHEKRSALQSSLTVYSRMHDIVRDVEEQLVLLGIGYFDALLAHDPHNVEPTLSSNGILAGMLERKKRGLVHWIGFCVYPNWSASLSYSSADKDASTPIVLFSYLWVNTGATLLNNFLHT